MFTDKLSIGTSTFSVEIDVDLPSTVAECLADSKLNGGSGDDYAVACYVRAHRINLQEKSGAREEVRKLLAAASSSEVKTPEFAERCRVAARRAIAAYVRGARRAPTSQPKTLTLPEQKSYSLADFQKMAAAQGFIVEVQK